MIDLILLPKGSEAGLEALYERALKKAIELYIVSAYLTEWDAPAKLNAGCKTFRLIVGRDFGITRKDACRKVMKWLPSKLKNRFMVAEEIEGFHPKAMFWKETGGSMHALIGSSNLTRAAFSSNHEANVYQKLTPTHFEQARAWIRSIEPSCIAVSEDWLELYQEAPRNGPSGPSKKPSSEQLKEKLQLPRPSGAADIVRDRRQKLAAYRKHQSGLMKLFRDCAAGRVTSPQFYDQLPKYWHRDLGDRLQGAGWERQGKASDFKALSTAFLEIVNAKPSERDDVVADQIDDLRRLKVSSRTSFLSEMLCLRFPDLYPVKNQPVEDFLADIRFKGPRGASEGAAYVDLAQRLRMALRVSKGHPAKNIAELDAVIWLKYTPT